MKFEEIIPLKDKIRDYTIAAYKLCGQNKTELSKILGITPRTIRDRLRAYGYKYTKETTPSEERFKVKTLRHMVGEYFAECYVLCDYNKLKLSRTLQITFKTVQNYFISYKIDTVKPPRWLPAKVLEEGEYPAYFDCMRFIKPEERDHWYNKDYL